MSEYTEKQSTTLEDGVDFFITLAQKKGWQHVLARANAVETLIGNPNKNIGCRISTVKALLGIQKSQIYRLHQKGKIRKFRNHTWCLRSVIAELKRREQTQNQNRKSNKSESEGI